MLDMISICPRKCSKCTWKQCIFCFCGVKTLKITVKSIWSSVSFKAIVSLLIFCLEDLFIDVNGILKSPTMTVFLSISPFMSLKICFIYLGAPMLVNVYEGYNLFLDWSLYHYVMSFFVSYNLFKSLFYLTQVLLSQFFFKFAFTWNIFFQLFTSSLCISFVLKCVFYRKHINKSCFLTHSTTLYFSWNIQSNYW